MLAEERVDVTLPWDRTPRGARHPLTTLTDRIADIFVGMGYEVADGPELEAEWLNFDALNIGRDHPARTMMDTFFVAPGGLRPGAAHAHQPGAGAHDAVPHAADLRRRARAACTAPTSSTRRTPRCSTRSRAWPSTAG